MALESPRTTPLAPPRGVWGARTGAVSRGELFECMKVAHARCPLATASGFGFAVSTAARRV